ncbi:MAG: AraC family ligand binding domain-containing protein, partial [Acidobacteriaceae bacterium]|nr:AraC family ligand binding domain-containing protein [Acidobacteriaceae bacterium]
MNPPAVLINPREAELGRANVILRGRGRQHFVENYPGPLSVKCVIRGEGYWRTDDGNFRVDERSLLVLNHEEPYTLTIDSNKPVSTCCLFFAKGFVEAMHHSATSALSASLD